MSMRRISLAGTALASILAIPGVALAQTSQASPAAAPGALLSTAASGGGTENVTVVGSALNQAANQNANPVQIITAKQIQQTSAVTIGDYLQRLPSIGSSAQQNTQPNGGDGISCTDIRNLGINRVLVLVDGKRQVETYGNGSACVNLNAIPVDQVASIEILKDGGSELYGADAVSGVINIKLKHDLTGTGIDVRGGETDIADGQTGKISAYHGFDFDQGRGNVTLFGQYQVTNGIAQSSRPWAVPTALNDPLIGGVSSYGSGLTANTRVIDPNGNFDLVSNGTGGGVNGFHTKSAADNFPYYDYQSLTNELQSSSLSADTHYDFNPHITLYGNARYTHQTASNQLAPLGVTGASAPSTLLSSVILPAGSPYNIFGEDVDLYHRFAEVGPREYSEAFDTSQYMAGAKGQIVGNWNYDASYTYGQSRGQIQTGNLIDYGNLLRELGDDQLDPSDPNSAVLYNPSVCTSQSRCVLANPFSPLNTQAADYLRYKSTDYDSYQMRDFNLRVDNSKVAQLPWTHGGAFGLAMGLEHRSEQANYSPDPLSQSGELGGGGGTYTGGGYDTTEAYIEGKLQLLHDAPLAKDLTIDGQGRWSDYNTFGDTYNWKGSINWAPVRDIRFRGTLGTSFRAPAISELYAAQGLGYYSATDPCGAVSSYGAYAGNVQARCSAEGINTATFVNANTGTVPALVGGNPQLQPEIGRTYTIGTEITPRWVPGLDISVEYWHYMISDAVGTLPLQYILDECYTGQASSYCSLISRSSSKQLSQVVETTTNVGGERTNGIDFDLNYIIRLTHHDTLTINNNLQQLIGYTEQNLPGGPWVNYTGRLFYLSGTGNPRLRDYASITWTHRNFALTYMLNYTSGMIYNDGSNDVDCTVYAFCKVPGIFSHDVTANYRLGQWNLQAGVNNILDKRPPYIPGGNMNTAPGLYASEEVGRFIFADISTRF